VAICESARGFRHTEIEFKKKPARISGRCRLMPRCLPDDPCTSFLSAGSIRSTLPFRPSRNTWARGAYATAGFVANVGYCAAGSGLGRGFSGIATIIFPKFTAFKLAVLVERTLKGIEALSIFLDDLCWSGSTVDRLLQNPNARFRVLPA
jgi:hypothetical protein